MSKVSYIQVVPSLTMRRFTWDTLLVGYVNSAIVLLLMASDEHMWHWFLIPVVCCGILTGNEGLRWIKGEYALFDPKGMAGALCWHMFFLAPLLFIYWNSGLLYVADQPYDWRPWVGYMSVLDGIAWIIYQKAHDIGFLSKCTVNRTERLISVQRALPLFALFAGGSLFAEVYFLVKSGGIAGQLAQLEVVRNTGQNPATGLAMVEAIGNSFPIIVLIYLSLRRGKASKRCSIFGVFALLVLFGGTQLIMGGWESRTATVWSVLWFVGIIHHFWRPIDKKILPLGLGLFLLFMYIYGFYKGGAGAGGVEALQTLAGGQTSVSGLEVDTGRTFRFLIITDLSRIDVQSYELYRLANYKGYELRWGKTYVSDVVTFVPTWLWKGKPADGEKIVAGTDLTRGRWFYTPGERFWNAMFVYGPAGEAMLNWGMFAAPIPFALIGFLMGRYRHRMMDWSHSDARQFLVPLVAILFLLALSHDLDNTLAILIYKGSPVVALIWLASRRYAGKSAL